MHALPTISRLGAPSGPDSMRPLVLLSAGALGFSAIITQLTLMRELLSACWGNELALGVILGNWLLATGLGAWAGRFAGRLQAPGAALAWGQWLLALLPIVQVFVLRCAWTLVFPRGAAVSVTDMVLCTFTVLAPYCLVAGFLLTLACALLEDGDAVGSVYVADALGSIAGGLLFTFVLVSRLDHLALLCCPAAVNLLTAGALARRLRSKALIVFDLAAAAGLVLGFGLADPDRFSTALQQAPLPVAATVNSPYSRLVVTRDANQFNVFANGAPVASSHDPDAAEEAAHFAMAQRPGAGRVLLISGGLSGTASEILKHGCRQVTYMELDPWMVALGRRFMPDALADPRIRIETGDARSLIRQGRERYDVVIIDLPEPSTWQLNRFYTVEFHSELKRVMTAGGVLSFSVGRYENYVSKQLAQLLASTLATVRQSFSNVMVLPAGRVFFLASDGPLSSDIAARLEKERIVTRLLKPSYLEAMLSPDRMADIRRATGQPSAAINKDFDPTLPDYHLRHWLGQFPLRFGLVEAVLVILFVAYIIRLRAPPLALFASGFAASGLELVLLLAFQVFSGAVYYEVGLLVTAFMAGLAAGGWAGVHGSTERSPAVSVAVLGFAIAGFAAALPFLLALLNTSRLAAFPLWPKLIILFATVILAALVGLQFSRAGQLRQGGTAAAASRLYTADFVGASLGALLGATLLIPALGLTAACLVMAGLNLVGGLSALRVKNWI